MTEEVRAGIFTILPATTQQVQESFTTATGLLEVLQNWQLQTPEDVVKAGELLTGAHARWKALDELRKSVTQPAYQAQKTINDHFRPALDAWLRAKNETKRVMQEYRQIQEAANQARIEAAAAGNAAALAQVQEIVPPPGVSYQEDIDIQITNFDLIPREWLSVDWGKLKIAAHTGQAPPPGVTFTRKPKVVVTGR
jgi:hypothetical protein